MSARAIIRVPNVWRRSWKRSASEAGPLLSARVAAAERRAVEVAAGLAGEDEVVVAGQALALAEAGERAGDVGRHRDDADLAGLRRGQRAVGVARRARG